MKIEIKKGEQQDVEAAFYLIKELAVFEKAPNEVTNSPDQMLIDGFGPKKLFDFYVAKVEGRTVGLSIFYYRYSTWKGKCLYLEDLIVTESYRGNGIGKALFEQTIQFGKENGCKKMVWQVLDWNTPAIEFYKTYQSNIDEEWFNCMLDL